MPPFFFTMLAMMGIDIFSKKEATPVQPLGVAGLGNLYQNFLPNDRVKKAIKVFESGLVTVKNAYRLKGENQYTIGNGTSYLYLGTYKPFLRNGSNAVRSTDTLDSLKKLMGYSSYSDNDFAFALTINYLVGSGVYQRIAKDLDNLGVIFDQNFAEFLYETSYGSGSIWLKNTKSYTRNQLYIKHLNQLKLCTNSLQRFSQALKYRLDYYRIDSNAWQINFRGWTKRIIASGMYFCGYTNDLQLKVNEYDRNFNQRRLDLRKYFFLEPGF